jgi:thiamine-phosphate pyrophosphorylase
MLVVVSSPVAVPREAEWCNALFDAGLEVLHLRKPDAVEAVLNDLLQGIDAQYHDRLAWHQHHGVGGTWGMRRRHLTSAARQQTTHTQLEHWKASGQTISTSIHAPEEYIAVSPVVDYVLLGPVFESISKPGYRSSKPLLSPARGPQATKVIAIGGVEPHRCEAVSAAGFDGIAVLGFIWQRGNPVENFKQVQEAWYIHDRL